MDETCISACQEKERLGIRHGWCAVCVAELQGKLRTLRADRDRLRAALVGLIGVSDRAELESLEAVMRQLPAPAEDRAVSLDAIHALLATVEE